MYRLPTRIDCMICYINMIKDGIKAFISVYHGHGLAHGRPIRVGGRYLAVTKISPNSEVCYGVPLV